MELNRWLERVLAWGKARERRYYLSDYEDLRFRAQGIGADGQGLYGEKIFRAVPGPAEVKSILIFKPDDMGDTLMALPAIGRIRANYPDARLTVLCQRATRTVFERTGWFDQMVAIDVKSWALRFRSFSMKEALAKLPEQPFDVSVFLRTYPAYFRQFLKIPARYQVHPVDPRLKSKSIAGAPVHQWGEKREHQTLQMLQIAAYITGEKYGPGDVKFPTFQWTEDDRKADSIAFGFERPSRYLVAHPFANFETRRYPYWSELLARVERQTGFPVYLIGAASDGKLGGVPDERQLQGKLALGQSGYFMSRAAGFLGNHSGPAHWAAVLGIPTVSIFSGHSLASEWGPVGKTLILSLETACTPCHRRYCPGYGIKCLTELTPDRISRDVELFFKNEWRPRSAPRQGGFAGKESRLDV